MKTFTRSILVFIGNKDGEPYEIERFDLGGARFNERLWYVTTDEMGRSCVHFRAADGQPISRMLCGLKWRLHLKSETLQ